MIIKDLEGLLAMGVSLNTAANLQLEGLLKRIHEILDEIENEIKYERIVTSQCRK